MRQCCGYRIPRSPSAQSGSEQESVQADSIRDQRFGRLTSDFYTKKDPDGSTKDLWVYEVESLFKNNHYRTKRETSFPWKRYLDAKTRFVMKDSVIFILIS